MIKSSVQGIELQSRYTKQKTQAKLQQTKELWCKAETPAVFLFGMGCTVRDTLCLFREKVFGRQPDVHCVATREGVDCTLSGRN